MKVAGPVPQRRCAPSVCRAHQKQDLNAGLCRCATPCEVTRVHKGMDGPGGNGEDPRTRQIWPQPSLSDPSRGDDPSHHCLRAPVVTVVRVAINALSSTFRFQEPTIVAIVSPQTSLRLPSQWKLAEFPGQGEQQSEIWPYSRGCHKDAHPPFFLLWHPISDVWWLPTNRHRLPTNRHRLPTNHHRLHTNRHRLPTNRHQLCTNRHRLPTNRHRLPTNRHWLPTGIVGRIGHSEFFFSFITAPPALQPGRPRACTCKPREGDVRTATAASGVYPRVAEGVAEQDVPSHVGPSSLFHA